VIVNQNLPIPMVEHTETKKRSGDMINSGQDDRSGTSIHDAANWTLQDDCYCGGIGSRIREDDCTGVESDPIEIQLVAAFQPSGSASVSVKGAERPTVRRSHSWLAERLALRAR